MLRASTRLGSLAVFLGSLGLFWQPTLANQEEAPPVSVVVDVEFWDATAYHLSEEFTHEDLTKLRWILSEVEDESFRFTPRQPIHNGGGTQSGSDFDVDVFSQEDDCTNAGRYCAYGSSNDDDDENDGGIISGASVVKESLRRLCIWKLYTGDGGDIQGTTTTKASAAFSPWWSYVGAFLDKCNTPETFDSETCVNFAYRLAGIRAIDVETCMNESGGLVGDVPNVLLEEELAIQAESGSVGVIAPAVFVNDDLVWQKGPLPFQNGRAVLNAICEAHSEKNTGVADTATKSAKTPLLCRDPLDFLGKYHAKMVGCKPVTNEDPPIRARNGDSVRSAVLLRFCPSTGCHEGSGDVLVGLQTFVEAYLRDQGHVLDLDEDEEEAFLGLAECLDWQGSGYFIGPACTDDGEGIKLDLFTDPKCTMAVEESEKTFASISNGWVLPYSDGNLVPTYYFYDCGIEPNQQDTDHRDRPREFCAIPYEESSARCEDQMKFQSPYGRDTTGCGTIAAIFPEASPPSPGSNSSSSSSQGPPLNDIPDRFAGTFTTSVATPSARTTNSLFSAAAYCLVAAMFFL